MASERVEQAVGEREAVRVPGCPETPTKRHLWSVGLGAVPKCDLCGVRVVTDQVRAPTPPSPTPPVGQEPESASSPEPGDER